MSSEEHTSDAETKSEEDSLSAAGNGSTDGASVPSNDEQANDEQANDEQANDEQANGEQAPADASSLTPAGDAGEESSDKEADSADQPLLLDSPESAAAVVAELPETTGEGSGEPSPKAPEKEPHPDLRWYVVNAYSSYELKAKRALEERIRQHDLGDLFGEVHVPQETVVELVRGEKKTSNRKFFPGYILVQMVLNEDTWHLVKETPKISGFVGDASDPVPLSEEEVGRILQQVEEGAASPRARVSFEQGDTVKVIDGPFTDFNGTIEEVKPEKGKVKVLISIFGRATPVELDFIQVEKS